MKAMKTDLFLLTIYDYRNNLNNIPTIKLFLKIYIQVLHFNFVILTKCFDVILVKTFTITNIFLIA